jgi:4,5-DOPA dioxygenase extradiol
MDRNSFLKWMAATPFLLAMTRLDEIMLFLHKGQKTEKMPALFMGHGSPMNAIEENEFVKGFRDMAKGIPTPKAILCISAHWYTRGTMVTGMEKPPTIHDFGGFPQALFDVQYPAPGSPELATQVKEMMSPLSVHVSDEWGLDHGAWSVIKHMYPKADVPVIQMSIDQKLNPRQHFELGSKLKDLRNKGILIIGSGNIVHNLGMVDWANFNKDNHGFDWAIEARAEINKFIMDEYYQPLFEYNTHSKAFQNAIPTPDHFLPLMYVLGLKDKQDKITFYNDKLMAGSLSMTSVRVG